MVRLHCLQQAVAHCSATSLGGEKWRLSHGGGGPRTPAVKPLDVVPMPARRAMRRPAPGDPRASPKFANCPRRKAGRRSASGERSLRGRPTPGRPSPGLCPVGDDVAQDEEIAESPAADCNRAKRGRPPKAMPPSAEEHRLRDRGDFGEWADSHLADNPLGRLDHAIGTAAERLRPGESKSNTVSKRGDGMGAWRQMEHLNAGVFLAVPLTLALSRRERGPRQP